MTLKDLIKENKLKEGNYISLYNKDEVRFYGEFVNSKKLDRYMNYEAEIINKEPHSKFIVTIKLLEYEYGLGLDSLEQKENERSKGKENIYIKRK